MIERLRIYAIGLLLLLNVVCGTAYFARTWFVDSMIAQQAAVIQQQQQGLQQQANAIQQWQALAQAKHDSLQAMK